MHKSKYLQARKAKAPLVCAEQIDEILLLHTRVNDSLRGAKLLQFVDDLSRAHRLGRGADGLLREGAWARGATRDAVRGHLFRGSRSDWLLVFAVLREVDERLGVLALLCHFAASTARRSCAPKHSSDTPVLLLCRAVTARVRVRSDARCPPQTGTGGSRS